MKLQHTNSPAQVEVSAEKAKKLLSTGNWVKLKNGPEMVEVAPEPEPEVEATPEPVEDSPRLPEPQEEATQEDEKPAPSIPEMRKWALENEIEGVKAKGKLPKSAIDAYMEAHKD